MTATSRPYAGDDDFWKVRRLLIETHPITGPGFNWDIRRWDGTRFYNVSPDRDLEWEKQARLWETADGRVVGGVHIERRPGMAHLELHPDYRPVEEEMVAWAEEHLAGVREDGQARQLAIYVYEYDEPRLRLLEARGYERLPLGGVIRRTRLAERTFPRPSLAEGYTLRTTRPGDEDDFQRVADLLNAAFERTFHNPGEYRTFTRLAPCFRHDLDLVAEAPDGSLAALVGVVYDEANRRGLYEPVCTHPDHRRQRLAQTLMLEGLHRLRALGAVEVTVEAAYQAAANRLYGSLGFGEAYRGHVWKKLL